jgi:hypothetical protein
LFAGMFIRIGPQHFDFEAFDDAADGRDALS